MIDIIYLLFFILPAYVASSSPLILGGKTPIDFNKKFFDNKPIFGKGKTWAGFFGGFFAGVFCSILEAKLLISTPFDLFASNIYIYLQVGILLSFGAVLGDLLGSFIKRRLGYKQGKPSFLLDQLSFLVVSLAFVYFFGFRYIFSFESITFLFLFTYFIHKLANYLAYLLKIKKVPW
jgi:CDP-2,3-bis-(O-geranylgeranyl)-sn-glycerol synthase